MITIYDLAGIWGILPTIGVCVLIVVLIIAYKMWQQEHLPTDAIPSILGPEFIQWQLIADKKQKITTLLDDGYMAAPVDSCYKAGYDPCYYSLFLKRRDRNVWSLAVIFTPNKPFTLSSMNIRWIDDAIVQDMFT